MSSELECDFFKCLPNFKADGDHEYLSYSVYTLYKTTQKFGLKITELGCKGGRKCELRINGY
jgi:hypothetical protein